MVWGVYLGADGKGANEPPFDFDIDEVTLPHILRYI